MALTMAPAEATPDVASNEDINIRCSCCGATAWSERPELIAAHECGSGDWFSFVVPDAA